MTEINIAGYWRIVWGHSEKKLTVGSHLYAERDTAVEEARAMLGHGFTLVGVMLAGVPVVEVV